MWADEYSETALTITAEQVAKTDADHAARLVDEAERIARTSTDDYDHAGNIWRMAMAVAATDPDRALGLTREVTDERLYASARIYIAKSPTATDPDRALRLFGDVERVAQSATDPDIAADILLDLVEAWRQR